MYFRLMAAIFELADTPTSKDSRTTSTVLQDPKNVR